METRPADRPRHPRHSRQLERLGRLGKWLRSLDFTLARRFGLANREDRLFFLLIAAVGVIGGLLGAATDLLIGLVQRVLWGSTGDLLAIVPKVHRWVVVAAPAIGGAVVGAILWLSRRRAPAEAGGEGMGMLNGDFILDFGLRILD